MAKMQGKTTIANSGVRKIADEVRDTINWIAIFETEYELPKEVVQQLRSRLEKIAALLGNETL